MPEVIKIKSKTLPILLYFLADGLPTREEADEILSIDGYTICQRNVSYDDGSAMEPCTAVAGSYPERYADWALGVETKAPPIKEPKLKAAGKATVPGWNTPPVAK